MAERLLTLATAAPGRRSRPRPDEHAVFRDLDRVRVREDVLSDDGVLVPAGAVGTVVAIWAKGAAYEVEFIRPVDALATVETALLELVERAAD